MTLSRGFRAARTRLLWWKQRSQVALCVSTSTGWTPCSRRVASALKAGGLGSEIPNRLVDWFRLSYEGLLNEATGHRSWRKQPAVGVKTRQATIKRPWLSILV